ncbi:chemotaxis protein CheA [Sulfurimonas sp.]|uniref:chemotaxis protein CheA n=1 Tax=Sulfurimonas sp. TaxID=2022749 RepID=UPI00356AA11D
MDKEQIRNIFIEEATEIIENLDVNIINFEENPEDKDILNELFRGVHTLKGSANSFGFTRLGEFVHHFEDVLDHYRNTDDIVDRDSIDIFFSAVDVIKEVMWREVEGDESVPDNYAETLEGIKSILKREKGTSGNDEEMPDLASEFGNSSDDSDDDSKKDKKKKKKKKKKKLQQDGEETEDMDSEDTESNSDYIDEAYSVEDIQRLKDQIQDGENLYHIKLTLDDDIYFRGYDHAKIFKLLSDDGRILESWWDMSNISDLDAFDPERSQIKCVDLFIASRESEDDIREFFEYIEDNEYMIKHVSTEDDDTPEPEPLKDEDIKFGRRAEDKETEAGEIKEAPQDKGNIPQRRKSDMRSFVKIDTNKLDELFDSVGELVIAQNFIAESEDIKRIKSESVSKTINHLSKITRLIQNRVMGLRMVAVHDTFEKMKRVARDASKKVNKEIALEIDGAETEIDKTMVDSLSDPLIHIMRNAIDHGLEDTPEDRVEAGKHEVGVIRLRAFHRGGNIAIEVSDDGRGINRDKVFAKAVERGLINENDELSDSQVFSLIMQAGFSTADTISDISGRGVGLDVVRTAIEKLQGKVEIASEVGKGSTFTILLPLTLAIIDGMVVKSANDTFIIPTLSVVESFIPSKDIIHSMKKKGEFVDLRGEMIPIVRLNHVLSINEDRPEISESTLMCLENENGKYALLVDDLIGRQQVVIKSLGPTLSKIKELSGSAIMGSGEIALILNVEELHAPEVSKV